MEENMNGMGCVETGIVSRDETRRIRKVKYRKWGGGLCVLSEPPDCGGGVWQWQWQWQRTDG